MTNRTDYHVLVQELAAEFGTLTPDQCARIETELHDAHAAGMEGGLCGCRWCVADAKNPPPCPSGEHHWQKYKPGQSICTACRRWRLDP
jgi:hypothetical protein